METILTYLFTYSRLLFAFCFLTPLVAQIMVRSGFAEPFGVPALFLAAVLAGALGLKAHVSRRWL